MELTATTTRTAYPMVANASPLYLQLLAMEVGEVLEIKPSDLPRSYKSIRTFVANISRRYKQYYIIKMLINPTGWRIIRAQNLEVVKEVSIFKSKSKKMENEETQRNNNMGDSTLAQKADEVNNTATEDLAVLTPRGVTAVRLAALAVKVDAFKQLDDDVQMQGDVSIAISARTQAYTLLTDKIGNVRTMAQNKFGQGSPQYDRIGFEGMISANDKDLVHQADRINREAIKVAADLAPEGWTATFATDFKAAIVDFDTKRDAVVDAEHNRKEATRVRILAGNEIYTELEKICNTGKDVFRMTNPTRHDFYLLYDTPSNGGGGGGGGGGTPPTIAPFTVGSNGSQVLLNQPYNSSFKVEIKNTSMATCKVFLSSNGVTASGMTLQLLPNSTATYLYSDLAPTGDFLVLANENGMISATGEIKYPV